jgi:hypothetical protein
MDVARGIVAPGVHDVHVLYILLDDLMASGMLQPAWLQIKVPPPHGCSVLRWVVTSAALPEKGARFAASRALPSALTATFSQVVGTPIEHMLWTPWTPIADVLGRSSHPRCSSTGT